MYIDNDNFDPIPPPCQFPEESRRGAEFNGIPISLLDNVKSLDSSEELICALGSAVVMRANRNWAARLAAVALLNPLDKGHCVSIVGGKFCWNCMGARYTEPEPHLLELIID